MLLQCALYIVLTQKECIVSCLISLFASALCCNNCQLASVCMYTTCKSTSMTIYWRAQINGRIIRRASQSTREINEAHNFFFLKHTLYSTHANTAVECSNKKYSKFFGVIVFNTCFVLFNNTTSQYIHYCNTIKSSCFYRLYCTSSRKVVNVSIEYYQLELAVVTCTW